VGTRQARREIATGARKGEAEQQVQLPFTLARQRPNKSRLEIQFAGKTSVQVYDGAKGWKLRPYLNRNDVEPFTAQEAKAEAENDGLDDPLIDSAVKGTKVELEGVEPVEGHAAYKLRVAAGSGAAKHVWIDAHSFLDVKVEGVPRRMDGRLRSVWVVQRDFRAVQGLIIPFVLETVVEGFPQTHRIVLEKVAVNPKLDATTFAKPKT
jgi:outer membrane lipoprotein-sorting protein